MFITVFLPLSIEPLLSTQNIFVLHFCISTIIFKLTNKFKNLNIFLYILYMFCLLFLYINIYFRCFFPALLYIFCKSNKYVLAIQNEEYKIYIKENPLTNIPHTTEHKNRYLSSTVNRA